jgi:large repetitive protein
VTVKNPDGTTYVYDSVDGVYWSSYPCAASGGGCGFKLLNLTQTGTYSVTVVPNGAATMSFTATLSTDVTQTLAVNTPYALNLQYLAQEGLPSFTATAGQTFALQVSGISTTPASNIVYIYVIKPGGAVLTTANTTTGTTINLPNLAAGTYQVLLAVAHGDTATMTVELVP